MNTEKTESGLLHCKTKLILAGENDFFGPGIFHLLQNIDRTGSIRQAAELMQMSYSKSCKLLNKAEQEMGFAFLNRKNGGKTGGCSTLTEKGRLFMERYQIITAELERTGQDLFHIYFQDFQKPV